MDWWIIITIIMNGISFILNGLFLFVLARNKDLVKRKCITYHVANIAVADTLYGLVRSCFFIVLLHLNEVTYKTFRSTVHDDALCCLLSITGSSLMTIERSIVNSKPYISTLRCCSQHHFQKDGLADSQKCTRQLPQAANQQKSIHLEHKASILVLLLAVIMIVTCLPSYLLRMITSICYEYKLHCNLKANLTIIVVLFILENLNFLVNPLL